MTPPLRIAIVAQAWDCVPSRTDEAAGLGIKHLADALVARGHTVLLCAVGPSHSDARVVITMEQPAQDLRGSWEAMLTHVTQAIAATIRFQPDIIHDFTGVMPMIADSALSDVPFIVTVGEPLSGWRKSLIRQTVEKSEAKDASTLFIAATPWIQESVPSIPWTSSIPYPVSVHDCAFGTVKQPFALHIGPLHPMQRPFDVVNVAEELQLPITVITDLAEAEAQAFYANHLAGRDHIALVSHGDALTTRRLLSQAQVFLTTDVAHSREPHRLARALASGTPAVVVNPPHAPAKFATNPVVMEVEANSRRVLNLDEIRAIDAYECRRIAAAEYSVSARAYEKLYADSIQSTTHLQQPIREKTGHRTNQKARELRAS